MKGVMQTTIELGVSLAWYCPANPACATKLEACGSYDLENAGDKA